MFQVRTAKFHVTFSSERIEHKGTKSTLKLRQMYRKSFDDFSMQRMKIKIVTRSCTHKAWPEKKFYINRFQLRIPIFFF